MVAAHGVYMNPHKAQEAMLQAHNEFCTTSQAASGLCGAAGENAGLSLQASTLFTTAAPDTAMARAQNALINNMVGLPDANNSRKNTKRNEKVIGVSIFVTYVLFLYDLSVWDWATNPFLLG